MAGKETSMADPSKFRGTLLGGACGDALGFPVEKLTVRRIAAQFGPFGLRTMVRKAKNKRRAIVSDDTQMMLASADGLLWAAAKDLPTAEGLYRGYMRWYYCQTGEEPRKGQRTWLRRQAHEKDFCLIRELFMHTRRDPEDVSLTALNGETRGSLSSKLNDSKGSGVLLRTVPIGLYRAGDGESAFHEGMESAALTHSHKTALIAAGAAAALIAFVVGGFTLPKALDQVTRILSRLEGSDETEALLTAAVEDANRQPAGTGKPWQYLDCIRSLGSGRSAHEALAIAVFCALVSDDPVEAVIIAANHSGKSDTTAAFCGALEGARFGVRYLPSSWTEYLEGKDVILAMAEKLYHTHEKLRAYTGAAV